MTIITIIIMLLLQNAVIAFFHTCEAKAQKGKQQYHFSISFSITPTQAAPWAEHLEHYQPDCCPLGRGAFASGNSHMQTGSRQSLPIKHCRWLDLTDFCVLNKMNQQKLLFIPFNLHSQIMEIPVETILARKNISCIFAWKLVDF